ncbi:MULTISPECIES: hypothetical protein [Cryobacterium]|uniref:Uncharacterized protein n=1 Tax=Cryobacterium levicorallinum TaxID=995038 RepID=A0A1I3CPS9_9MICO|nr:MULTISPECIES: hypothetical protein [Cryobacterium]TFB87858.1 hypothetical protein E3O11_03365 [Cryobacterium levicorallinum]TFD61813.1 hypothetical protein E3T41_07250 [Cryobacterium sp. Hh38]GEP27825.1 hypothetical protein CLE01_24230 [Cryobacterium levicorallinum]SFH76535.1 hypothetical protein SAMN05216274_11450 [Cryobacterium levicorallinum]
MALSDLPRASAFATPSQCIGREYLAIDGFGGGINAGHPEKVPAKLTEHLWNLHTKRDQFRLQISAD